MVDLVRIHPLNLRHMTALYTTSNHHVTRSLISHHLVLSRSACSQNLAIVPTTYTTAHHGLRLSDQRIAFARGRAAGS